MGRSLTDLPLAELRRALKATEAAAGANSKSAAAIRRAIEQKKRQAPRPRRPTAEVAYAVG